MAARHLHRAPTAQKAQALSATRTKVRKEVRKVLGQASSTSLFLGECKYRKMFVFAQTCSPLRGPLGQAASGAKAVPLGSPILACWECLIAPRKTRWISKMITLSLL